MDKSKSKHQPATKTGTTESRLDYACDTLGFTKTNLGTITVIDFALDDICRIDWLIHFPNLRELNIVNNGLTEIEGLDKCKLLEKVWLNCNMIDTIRMMDRLPMLR
jgi:hypothetical protein